MVGLNINSKLNLLFYGPASVIFILNTIALFLLEMPKVLMINFLIYVSAMLLSKMFFNTFKKSLLRTLDDVHIGLDTIKYSSKLLSEEFKSVDSHFHLPTEDLLQIQDSLNEVIAKNDDFDEIYSAMKSLLIQMVQRKESLVFAKELGKICADSRSMMIDLQNMLPGTQTQVAALLDKMEMTYNEQGLITSEIIFNKTVILEGELEGLCFSKNEEEIEEEVFPFKTSHLRRVA
jgi:hypothetical protein